MIDYIHCKSFEVYYQRSAISITGTRLPIKIVACVCLSPCSVMFVIFSRSNKRQNA